jgi:hypothetical protein
MHLSNTNNKFIGQLSKVRFSPAYLGNLSGTTEPFSTML